MLDDENGFERRKQFRRIVEERATSVAESCELGAQLHHRRRNAAITQAAVANTALMIIKSSCVAMVSKF